MPSAGFASADPVSPDFESLAVESPPFASAAGGSAAAAVCDHVSESPSERALPSKTKADEFDRFTDVSSWLS